MTIEELRQKPVGVLETRRFPLMHKGKKFEEEYYLVKDKDSKYYIGFSDDASYCSERVYENDMILLLNDEECSNMWAWEIYIRDPHLSCWMK